MVDYSIGINCRRGGITLINSQHYYIILYIYIYALTFLAQICVYIYIYICTYTCRYWMILGLSRSKTDVHQERFGTCAVCFAGAEIL